MSPTRTAFARVGWRSASCILGTTLLIAGCSDATTQETASSATASEYVVMGEDLADLKADFNAAVDQVRLLFIVGPT